MKLFWKIFAAVLISFIIVFSFTFYIVSDKVISNMENNIIEEYRMFANHMSKDIEVSHLQSEWPFEMLYSLSKSENFLFWWIVEDNNTIHMADNAAFMGTYVDDYFPPIADIINDGGMFLNYKKNIGIFIKPIDIGKEKWSFWLGFSLKKVLEAKKKIMLLIILSSISALLILGFLLYFTIKYFTKPIQDLTKSANQIKRSNLSRAVKVTSKDEIGELAKRFDEMRLGLKDRNDLLKSLLKTFKGKFGNLATILVRKNVQELVKKNPRIQKILPKSIGASVTKATKLQRERERARKK